MTADFGPTPTLAQEIGQDREKESLRLPGSRPGRHQEIGRGTGSSEESSLLMRIEREAIDGDSVPYKVG
jgi:hypothetical protein